MAKIPFDIKFRPQIESGEYKVETECGHPVSIMDWEWIDRNEKKCLAVKVLMDEGFNIGYLFNYDGKRHSIFPSDSDSDLFIITPEPELSEFEKAVDAIYESCGVKELQVKKKAAELLALAREELFANDTVLKEYAQASREQGKAEALKDLPRWGKGSIEGDRIVGLSLYHNMKWISFSDLEKLPGFKEDESHE